MTDTISTVADSSELPTYPKRGIVMSHGLGARLWDTAGREYIDCAAGIGVGNIGHANERLARTVAEQARRLIVCPGSIDTGPRIELCAKLREITPDGLERSFLCNSGTEAMEAAIKFARLATGRTDFVACERAFHGRTLGALSGTHKPQYREPFMPLVPGFSHVPFNDLDALRAAVTDRTAGVLLEVVQGEGGIHPVTQAFIDGARAVCDERGALLIFDEVQSGFGRTGRMFALEHFGVVPDMLCIAKALGGGLPIGAVVCNDRIPAVTGRHGSTFGGNPLCAAAALATIEEIESRDLCGRAERLGEAFRARIADANLAAVREVRGLGLMIGVELTSEVAPILAVLQERGVIALGAGPNTVRLLPPLVIEEDQLAGVGETLVAVLGEQAGT